MCIFIKQYSYDVIYDSTNLLLMDIVASTMYLQTAKITPKIEDSKVGRHLYTCA